MLTNKYFIQSVFWVTAVEMYTVQCTRWAEWSLNNKECL